MMIKHIDLPKDVQLRHSSSFSFQNRDIVLESPDVRSEPAGATHYEPNRRRLLDTLDEGKLGEQRNLVYHSISLR